MSIEDAVLPFSGELPSPREVAHGVLDAMIENFRDPKYRVQFVTGVLATIPCTRARLPFLPAFVISMALAYTAGWAYESVEEIKSRLYVERAQKAPDPLLFHGFGCPGHTTGVPADCCTADDAARGV